MEGDLTTTRKGRPRKIEGETQTYNMIFPITLLDRVHDKATEENISSAELIRRASEQYLSGSPINYPAIENTADYQKGVADALAKVREARRLRFKMATGQTMGELVAEEIEADLNDDPDDDRFI